MTDDLISVVDIARDTGKLRQSIHKIIKRLRIEPIMKRSPERHGQRVAYISRPDYQRILSELEASLKGEDSTSEIILAEQGVFYLLQLEPTHDGGRFKVGFATNLSERLRDHRCSAPFAQIIKTWPCKRLWEKTAIEAVTDGCERVHTEVFRAPESIQSVLNKGDTFFAVMPKLK